MSIKIDGIETEVGRVVASGSYVTHYMSDCYGDKATAVIRNPDGTFERIEQWDMIARVDAPPEHMAEYEAYKVACEAARKVREEELRIARMAEAKRKAEEAARKAEEKARKDAEQKAKNQAIEAEMYVSKGDLVTIKTGKAKGREGKVFWMGDSAKGTKLGVALGEEKDFRGFHTNVAWVLMKNVQAA